MKYENMYDYTLKSIWTMKLFTRRDSALQEKQKVKTNPDTFEV